MRTVIFGEIRMVIFTIQVCVEVMHMHSLDDRKRGFLP